MRVVPRRSRVWWTQRIEVRSPSPSLPSVVAHTYRVERAAHQRRILSLQEGFSDLTRRLAELMDSSGGAD